MRRRYRRYRKRGANSNNSPVAAIALGLVFLIVFLNQYIGVIAIMVAVACVILLIKYLVCSEEEKEDSQDNNAPTTPQAANALKQSYSAYSSKTSIMTDCEKAYFATIRKIIAPYYIVQPQINLASVIDKTSDEKYRNELFRNVDFGVFDVDYRLIVLIEINDQTHTQIDRKIRDAKVHSICEEAGIPLVTFWTQYGINEQYMKGRLSQYLKINNIGSDENTSAPMRTTTTTEEENKNDDSGAVNISERLESDMDEQLDFESIMQEFSSSATDL